MSAEIRADFMQLTYNQNHISPRCEDVILEAKRVLLNEQLEKIANITLSEVNNSRKNIQKCLEQCENSLNWENELFWKELPNPGKPIVKKGKVTSVDFSVEKQQFLEKHIGNLMKINPHEIFKPEVNSSNFIRKYFNIWRETAQQKHKKVKVLENKIYQKEKLDKFMKKLKMCRKQEETKCKNQIKLEEESSKMLKQTKPLSSYKNRFIAQKSIIDMQKTKLEEQNKLIEELKLGIIREDLVKSLENTKINIREIFNSCSERIKCKVPILFIEEHHKFMVSTQKAPKFYQQMEERALARAQNRQIILERKRLIEETRKKMLEAAIEKKRVLEEEERKKNLELMKEKRKKELEQEKIRQAHKQKYLESLNKAKIFYEKHLIKNSFKELHDNFRKCKYNSLLAIKHYRMHLIREVIYCWCNFVEEKYEVKYKIADAHFAYKILKKIFKEWHDIYIKGIRNMQVAEDVYDFRLTSNTFIHWHRYVCSQIILQDKKIKIAEHHYKKRILLQYYYQWRSLPAVIQLERAKELKKQKWREKVWEVLPDYQPPEDI